MNPEYKQLITKLSEELKEKTFEFVLNFLEDEKADKEEDIEASNLLSLIFSSHLTAMFNAMNVISELHPELNEQVEKFTKKILGFIASLDEIDEIDEMEVTYNHKE